MSSYFEDKTCYFIILRYTSALEIIAVFFLGTYYGCNPSSNLVKCLKLYHRTIWG